jgi:hypothetical protein
MAILVTATGVGSAGAQTASNRRAAAPRSHGAKHSFIDFIITFFQKQFHVDRAASRPP